MIPASLSPLPYILSHSDQEGGDLREGPAHPDQHSHSPIAPPSLRPAAFVDGVRDIFWVSLLLSRDHDSSLAFAFPSVLFVNLFLALLCF